MKNYFYLTYKDTIFLFVVAILVAYTVFYSFDVMITRFERVLNTRLDNILAILKHNELKDPVPEPYIDPTISRGWSNITKDKTPLIDVWVNLEESIPIGWSHFFIIGNDIYIDGEKIKSTIKTIRMEETL